MQIGRQTYGYWLMTVPLFVVVVSLYGWPILSILWLSVSEPAPGLGNFAKLFEDNGLLHLIWTTVRVCLITTVLSVAAGYLIAYVMNFALEGQRRWLMAILLLSFWISVLVRAFAWLTLLSRNGVLNNFVVGAGLIDEPITFVRNELGVLIGMVHYMIPYAALPLFTNMHGIDGRIASASRSLGAGPFTTFWCIFLPMTRPGIVAASSLVFIISLGFYVTPAILGGGKVLMIAEYVSVQILVTQKWGVASMLATLMLMGVFGVLLVLSRFMKLSEAFGAR